jgi:hypothetical protein
MVNSLVEGSLAMGFQLSAFPSLFWTVKSLAQKRDVILVSIDYTLRKRVP